MTEYSAAPVLAGLKDFQRDTVAHVIERFYGEEPTSRFLVADETGLGKSVVARGVIAETVARLQSDKSVRRIDVVYVCSNADIAKQNLARLQVTDGEHIAISSRLTMIAKESSRLETINTNAGKALNVIAFTPGTSFDRGWRTGKAEERALLFLILKQELALTVTEQRRAIVALRSTTTTSDKFKGEIKVLCRALRGNARGNSSEVEIDPVIVSEFMKEARRNGLINEFVEILSDIGRRTEPTQEIRSRADPLIGRLRGCLAKASVETLEPDLVILDEFQRFRHLLLDDTELDRPEAAKHRESAELAGQLFNYKAARVLLLSATPYKPYTLSEEGVAGDDHYRDFMSILRFLSPDPKWMTAVEELFEGYRSAMIDGRDAQARTEALRQTLLQVMTRTERPPISQNEMLMSVTAEVESVSASELRGFIALRRLADEVSSPGTIEYWKSAPYFVNFLEGYKLGHQLRAELKDPQRGEELAPLIEQAQLLDRAAMEQNLPIDLGNGRLKRLAAETVGAGWWRLLWIPPSMPHYELGEPFANAARDGITKRLVFSSWNATPTAVSGLLSYEAERRIFQSSTGSESTKTRIPISPRLEYSVSDGRPGAMSTLSLFWPHPGLAAQCDPLAVARIRPGDMQSRTGIEEATKRGLLDQQPCDVRGPTDTSSSAFFNWPGGFPTLDGVDETSGIQALSGVLGLPAQYNEDEDDTMTLGIGVQTHFRAAMAAVEDSTSGHMSVVGQQLDDLVSLGLHGPGNVAWRALAAIVDGTDISPRAHWEAAAVIASGFRSLFNRPETMALLDGLALNDTYWRAVLDYCADGGIQAVLDEYIHHLRSDVSGVAFNEESLMRLAQEVRAVLVLKSSRYQAFDPRSPDSPIMLASRFALRYGGGSSTSAEVRAPEVRAAFNSPFWPMVLSTTSAGQEGIDFHWWCSAVVHWNVPSNPVDFEQREGRIHRFGGHAVRRNVAARHRSDALSSEDLDVWNAAYAAACDATEADSAELGEFAPFWVYPGSAKIERYLYPYALSKDIGRTNKLIDELALYRVALGQPRQEDMINLLRKRGIDPSQSQALALNLRPPKRD